MRIDNLESGAWALIMFDTFKAHFCPGELAADLIADIVGRSGNVVSMERASEGGIDLPGIVLANRRWEDIPLDGFNLGFPAQDFEHFMAELEAAPERRFANGRGYHKIHGWLHCVVLTPGQRETVLGAMAAILPEVRIRAEEENRKFLEAMGRVNADKVRAVSWREAAMRGTVPLKDRN
jgi:hypothetical protein